MAWKKSLSLCGALLVGLSSSVPVIEVRQENTDTPTPTTTGPEQAPTTLASSIAPLPPNPTATYYNADGKLKNPAPAPFTPNGGLGTNGTESRYMVNSDFDYQSIVTALYQEWIELDLFNYGLEKFTVQDFLDAGLTAEDRTLIAFMASQEVGHAELLSNMLGESAPGPCEYNYPFTTVREFVDFNQKITRVGEAGVLGFINHVDSREVGQLLSQSIAIEGRQQMVFRQMSGLHPMPVWFETGIPQAWAWSLVSPYIVSCPANTTRLVWQNFPALHVLNQPNINRLSPDDTVLGQELVDGERALDPSKSTIPEDESCQGNDSDDGDNCDPAISKERAVPLSYPEKQVFFSWDAPGKPIGPNNSYVTGISAKSPPKFVAWVNQLNLTYTDLVTTGENEGYTYQPGGLIFEGLSESHGIVNDTMFVALTDSNIFLTPFNLTMINPHVVALGIYQSG